MLPVCDPYSRWLLFSLGCCPDKQISDAASAHFLTQYLARKSVCVIVCVYTHTRKHTHAHTLTQTHTYLHTLLHEYGLFVCLFMCMCLPLFVCVCWCVCVECNFSPCIKNRNSHDQGDSSERPLCSNTQTVTGHSSLLLPYIHSV